MTPERYQQLVGELEALSRTKPSVLRRRVRVLIALGYVYVFLVLTLVLIGIIALLWVIARAHAGGLVVKVALPLVGLVYVIVRSLWVRVDPPSGTVLAPGSAPALDTRIEEIRRALAAPRADQVLLTSDFNASVTQVPRLGILGWPRTYLTLGVPLMISVDRRQLDAVLAHEFAHLSGAHPKLGLWVYRMSRTWDQLLTQLQQRRSWGRKLFAPFIAWYAPRTHAYGYVLSRRDEYEADADAGRVVSPRAMAEALVAIELGGRALSDHVWPQIWRRAAEQPHPPDDCWSAHVTALRSDIPSEKRIAWLGSALARRAFDGDTHPALKERLAALGVDEAETSSWESIDATSAGTPRGSAAEHYLGALTSELLTSLDREWHSEAAESWRERHEQVKTMRAALATLDARERAGELMTSAEQWARAEMLVNLDEEVAAIPVLQLLVAREPEHGAAQLMLGKLLLAEGDDAGVAHARRAMELSSRFAIPAASTLHEYYSKHGMSEDALAMERLQREYAEEINLGLAERADVAKSDTLIPADLTQEFRERVHGAVQYDERVEEVWVARKLTSHLADYPMLVVVVVPRRGRSGKEKDDGALARDVLGHVDSDAYVHLFVAVATSKTAWLQKRIEAIEGTRVYARA
jgi:Zn-dependent protease with chaperone function